MRPDGDGPLAGSPGRHDPINAALAHATLCGLTTEAFHPPAVLQPSAAAAQVEQPRSPRPLRRGDRRREILSELVQRRSNAGNPRGSSDRLCTADGPRALKISSRRKPGSRGFAARPIVVRRRIGAGSAPKGTSGPREAAFGCTAGTTGARLTRRVGWSHPPDMEDRHRAPFRPTSVVVEGQPERLASFQPR